MILCVFSKILRQFGNDIRDALFAMYCQSICIFWINWFVFILYPVPFVHIHLYWYAYVLENCWGNWLKTFNFRLLLKWLMAITKDAKHSLKNSHILPTGQWFAQQLTILHYLVLSCTILHYLALSCPILHYLALSCTNLH